MNIIFYPNYFKSIVLFFLMLLFAYNTFAQNVQINSITLPNRVNVCGDGIDLNGNQSTVTINTRLLNGPSGNFTVQLPAGFHFISNVSANGYYSIFNNTNNNAPVFTSINATDQDLIITISADCNYTSNGVVTATAASGGSFITKNFITNIDEPNIIQLSWTNDNVTGVCIGATITRTIVIKNGDLGYVKSFQFQSINDPSSVQIVSTKITSPSTVTLTPAVNGDTTKYTITGAVFPAGTNGTSYFENQETITITQTIKVKGCNNLTGMYRTVFGCLNLPECQSAEHVSLINAATGVPSIAITKISDAPFPICSGSTTTSSGIWQLTNTGVGGCAALKFSDLHFDFGDYGPSGYGTVSDVRMLNATGTIVPITYPYNISRALLNFTGFTSDPDGPGGFDDINGDGIFDELPVGASVRFYMKVTVDVYYNSCTYYPAYNQMNIGYTVQSLCGVKEASVYKPYQGLPFVGRGGIVLTSAPSDMYNGDYGYIKGYESYEQNGWNCATPVLKLKVILPKGFQYAPTGNAAYTLGGSMLPTNPVTVIGAGALPDTVTFDVTYLLDADYKIPIKLNCGLGSGSGNIQVIAQYQCAAGCLPLYLGCQNYKITAHCPISCGSGIAIKNLKVERTTIGYTDYTYTTKVNPAVVNYDANPNNDVDLNQASPTDTINVRGTSAVTTAVVNSNLIYVVTVPEVAYNGYQTNVFGGAFGDNPLTWVGGNINIGSGPSVLGSPTTIIHVGTSWVFTFNFNNITPLPIGSTVTVNALFTINKSLYPSVGHAALIDYQVRGNFSENGVVCDYYGDHLYIFDSYDAKYQPITLNFDGCSELTYYQDFWHMGYDFSYPNECRVRRRMDSVVIELPAGVNYSSGGTWNNQVNGNVPMTVTETGSHLVMIPTPGVNQNLAYHYYPYAFPYFQVNLKAGCATPITGSIAYFKVYSTNFTYTGNTAAQQQAVQNANGGQPYNNDGYGKETNVRYNKPTIKINNANASVTTNPFSWTFTVTNPTTAPLSNVFLSFENINNNVTYLQLQDVTAAPITIPLSTYAGNKKWTGSGVATTLAGLATKTFKLTASTTNCNFDSVIVKAGWDCTSLPSNPLGYNCNLVEGNLYSDIASTGISFQTTISPIITQPLGSTINLESILFTNDLGHSFNNNIHATLPNGLFYTTNTAQVEYPSGSGSWVSLTPVFTVGGNGEQVLNFDLTSIIGANGLFGAADATGNNDKVKLKFSVKTACGFSTASVVRFDANASSPCNGAITSNPSYSDPILITGYSGYRWLGYNSNWFDPINWCTTNNSIPSPIDDVFVPIVLSNIYPIISTSTIANPFATCKKINIVPSVSVIINNVGALYLYGGIVNTGIINAIDGTIGAFSATDSIYGHKFLSNTIKNFVIGANVSLTQMLNDTLKVTGNVSFGNVNNNTLLTQGNLTLVSNALGTANVNDYTNNGANTGNKINGNVNIERYLFARKAWRLLATPINSTGSPSIKTSWGESGILTSTGYGTQLTGPSAYIGFDVFTQRVSIKYYDATTNTHIDINNTNNAIANTNGYFVFVRGDRSVGLYGLGSTTLRIKGQLLSGIQQFIFPNNTCSFMSFGNPYASRINFYSTTKQNIANSFTAWNPTSPGLYNVGAYETYTWNGSNYVRPGGIIRNFIESGEAVYLSRMLTGISKIKINETDKRQGSSLQSRVGVINATLEVLLYVRDTVGTNTYMADGVTLNFDSAYSNGLDNDDVRKFSNAYDNFSILKNGTKLIVERMSKLKVSDTISFNIAGMHTGAYRLDIDPSNLHYSELEPYFVDKFLGTKTALSFSELTAYNFYITSAAASYAADRFMIVFNAAPTGDFISISAKRNANNTITINWATANERNLLNYNIEQSNDGTIFTELALQNPIANNGTNTTYEILDAAASKANNWYRIKANNMVGTVKYSAIAMVAAVSPVVEIKVPKISVSPNLVINGIVNVRLENQVFGNYEIQVTNTIGQILYKQNLAVQTNNVLNTIKISNTAKGNYMVIIKNNEGNKVVLPFIIE